MRASFLEVWLTSAVVAYSEGLLRWLRGRVCGSPTGRLFQVSPAKFKWLGPSPAPQMGSASAGLPTSRELRLQQARCAVSVGKEIVFSACAFKRAARRERKQTNLKVELHICRCLPGGGIIEAAPAVWPVSGDYVRMAFGQIPHQIQRNCNVT